MLTFGLGDARQDERERSALCSEGVEEGRHTPR